MSLDVGVDRVVEAVRRAIAFAEERAEALLALIGAFFAVRFDIIRDFYQFLSLFFTEFKLPDGFKVFFGRLSALISIDFHFAFPTISPKTMYYIVFFMSLLFFLIARVQARASNTGVMDKIRAGNEVVTWLKKGKKSKWFIQGCLTVLLSLYFPVTRNSVIVGFSFFFSFLITFIDCAEIHPPCRHFPVTTRSR